MKSAAQVAQNSISDIDPTSFGQKMLDVFAKGRPLGVEANRARARETAEIVMKLQTVDVLAGWTSRGRAGRIARKMGGILSERHVKRILDKSI